MLLLLIKDGTLLIWNVMELTSRAGKKKRAGKYKIKHVYVLNFQKWHAHKNNIYSISKASNLGAKGPFILF